MWRIVLALELGEPGRVVELARDVEVSAIPSGERQATFYADVGRELATIRGRETQAVEAPRRGPGTAADPRGRQFLALTGLTLTGIAHQWLFRSSAGGGVSLGFMSIQAGRSAKPSDAVMVTESALQAERQLTPAVAASEAATLIRRLDSARDERRVG